MNAYYWRDIKDDTGCISLILRKNLYLLALLHQIKTSLEYVSELYSGRSSFVPLQLL